MLVNLHILGVQKAGTTALANFLHQHPDIYVIDGKEAHVFDHPQYINQANKKHIANKKYQQKSSNYNNEKIKCDATPITLFHEPFLHECVSYNPDAKFIVMLRNPIDRAVSHYNMSRKIGAETRCLLLAFLLEKFRLSKVKNQQSWPFTSPFRTQSYLARGCYSRQLKTLVTKVKSSQLLVIYQDELLNKHDECLEKVFNFLNLSAHPIPSAHVFSTEKKYTHWSDGLAKLYAKIVFTLKGENKSTWQKVLPGPNNQTH